MGKDLLRISFKYMYYNMFYNVSEPSAMCAVWKRAICRGTCVKHTKRKPRCGGAQPASGRRTGDRTCGATIARLT